MGPNKTIFILVSCITPFYFQMFSTVQFSAFSSIPYHQAPLVQKADNAIHRINHYPLYSAIGFAMTYPMDSDLSGG